MGIRNLNKYLYDNCSKSSIRKLNIEDMRYKTIVIDTSIYIYKYLKEDKLEINFRRLIKLFIKFHVRPIFIFDGKSPEIKSNLRKERSKIKKDAEFEYNKLNAQQNASHEILMNLKKKFVRVKQEDIIMLKDMMKYYDIETIQSEWEADSICADYVRRGNAWACLSDDMDMLVYGCSKVIREFSLYTRCAQLYTLPLILNDLKVSLSAFRDIMVISGTDYNRVDESIVTLNQTLKLYDDYKYQKKNNETFYDWLFNNTNYIQNYDELIKVRKMFV